MWALVHILERLYCSGSRVYWPTSSERGTHSLNRKGVHAFGTPGWSRLCPEHFPNTRLPLRKCDQADRTHPGHGVHFDSPSKKEHFVCVYKSKTAQRMQDPTSFSLRTRIWRIWVAVIIAEVFGNVVTCQLSHNVGNVAIGTEVLQPLMSTA